MILTEDLIIDGKEFVRHYTDSPIYDEEGNELPKLIQVETGYEFIDAVDLKPCKFTYIEKEETSNMLEFPSLKAPFLASLFLTSSAVSARIILPK